MSRRMVLKTDEALRDIEGIVDYITEGNPDAARRFLEQLDYSLTSLASMRKMGALRFPDTERLLSIRSLALPKPFRSYQILYKPLEDGILAIRVMHGARNIEDDLS